MRFSRSSIFPVTRQYAFHDSSRRLTLDERERHDFAAQALDLGLADNVCGPIGALDENVWMNQYDRFERRVLIENADEVHHFHAVEELGAFILCNDRTVCTFHPPDRRIAVDRNDKRIPQRARAA